jgi:hypothetical protein
MMTWSDEYRFPGNDSSMGEVSLIDVSKHFTLRVDGDVQNV